MWQSDSIHCDLLGYRNVFWFECNISYLYTVEHLTNFVSFFQKSLWNPSPHRAYHKTGKTHLIFAVKPHAHVLPIPIFLIYTFVASSFPSLHAPLFSLSVPQSPKHTFIHMNTVNHNTHLWLLAVLCKWLWSIIDQGNILTFQRMQWACEGNRFLPRLTQRRAPCRAPQKCPSHTCSTLT